MAVKTPLTPERLAAFAARHPVGALLSAEGVPEGSIHTTYRLRTDQGVYYLRLTEGLEPDALAFELGLLEHLTARGFPAPRPVHPVAGPFPAHLAGRPAVLFHEVPGRPLPGEALGPAHTAALGALLARLHAVSADYPCRRENPYGPGVIGPWLAALEAHPDLEPEARAALPGLTASLEASGAFARALPPEAVGTLHGDLFQDNVHWVDGRLGGILDFEMACTAPYVLDLAIVLLVWCWAGPALDPGRARALMDAYRALRPLGPGEEAALWDAARFAAVRYTVTRLRDFALSELPPERLVRKDWRRFRDRLLHLEALGPGGLRRALGPTAAP